MSSTEVDSPYNYTPTEWICQTVLVLFGVSTLLHVAEATYTRTWWLFPTVILAGLIECLGWSARLWSSYSPTLMIPFQIQITGTIIGPTPFLAALFVAFGRVIQRLGTQYSRLGPKWYTIIFCSADVISLAVQGAGGGIASGAEDNDGAKLGSDIMLGGIAFQLAVVVIFAVLAVEFIVRYHMRAPVRSVQAIGSLPEHGVFTKRLRILMGAIAFCTLVLFIRAIYRLIELQDGWNGRIISTQVYFNVLDGAMVILAFYTFNIAHPGYLLSTPAVKAEEEKFASQSREFAP